MAQNDETGRQDLVRRYLPDDAWLKSHILELTLVTLCNVQTNVHHPEDKARGLGYSLKYQLKPEPHLALGLGPAVL